VRAVQFAYNEEQNLLRSSVDRFVESRYGLAERTRYRAEPTGYSLANWKHLADLGLLGLMFSAEDGGLGGGARDMTAVMEALGGGMVVEPFLEEIIIAGRVLAELGSAAQKQEWLPRIIAGAAHLTLAHSESTARFNLADVRVRAEAHAGTWALSGEKSVVPGAGASNPWIVSARERGEHDDPGGIGFFLVFPDAAGIERRDFRLIDGAGAGRIRFQGTLAAARLAGGFEQFARCMDLARLAASAQMVGIMSCMLDSTIDHLRTRKQFGVPLSSFQAIQHRLARLYVRLEQARSHVCRAALFVDSGRDARRSIAGTKSYVGRAAIELGEACLHLHGGIGMSDELAIAYGFKRVLVLANLLGDPDADLVRFAELRSPGSDA
jgi:alkylation response protein AidB-like acyl-CoA dehydrogenase